ncbi:AAA family ATPase [Alienimonas californiensis]|uniref:Zeta toxin n=1 Tax=Alienimonas californiensis TaxID=2527989 RepID=A0A517PCP0_9PLAN|nr:AAA family ATPase [Alienimonas californiensis]QDT17135.1 Zeta toxin [Alienimonas californiensis]
MSSPDPLLALAEKLAGAPAELKETHISRVALAGPPGSGVVLKQCKPVDFGFVDLRTREQRRAALEKEHAVNDRFAPGVYRGGRELPDGEPVLEMLRLDEADTLEAKVKRGDATTADLDAVLDHLLPLFERSDRGPEVAKWGDPAVIRQNLTENLDVLEQAADRFNAVQFARWLRSRQLSHLLAVEAELRVRAAAGYVRDGHGDLRAEHIYLTPQGVRVLDGIAFSDRLRCIDVADEIAFLFTDLLRCDENRPGGGSEWSREIVRRYRERTDDPVSDSVLALYESYRHAVRGKVAALRAFGKAPNEASDLREALARMADARQVYASGEHGWPECVLLFGGCSGSGKSTVAAMVAERLGATHLRSDVIRKRLLKLAPQQAAPQTAYSPAVSERVYRELGEQVQNCVDWRQHVVADATFLRTETRANVVDAVAAMEVRTPSVLFVWCECDDAVAERRIAERAAAGGDASDATVEVRRKQVAETEPPTEAEFADQPSAALLRLDTDAPVETLAERVIDALRDLVRVAGSGGVQ